MGYVFYDSGFRLSRSRAWDARTGSAEHGLIEHQAAVPSKMLQFSMAIMQPRPKDPKYVIIQLQVGLL